MGVEFMEAWLGGVEFREAWLGGGGVYGGVAWWGRSVRGRG